MRKVALLVSLALTTLPAMAEILSCDALKTRVDAKLQEKGIQSYTLEIVPAEDKYNSINASSVVSTDKTPKGKEVGTCEGGTKRLMYIRGN